MSNQTITSKNYVQKNPIHSNWFPIIIHNRQAFYYGFLTLGLVIGLT